MVNNELKILKAKIALEKEIRKKKPETKLNKFLKETITSKRVFKKEKPGTVVFSKNVPQHSKHFKEEYERARWV